MIYDLFFSQVHVTMNYYCSQPQFTGSPIVISLNYFYHCTRDITINCLAVSETASAFVRESSWLSPAFSQTVHRINRFSLILSSSCSSSSSAASSCISQPLLQVKGNEKALGYTGSSYKVFVKCILRIKVRFKKKFILN